MNGIEIRPYIDRAGRNRFQTWLESLASPARAKVSVNLVRLENGNFSNTKAVGSGVSELRIDFGPGLRIYFGKDGDRLVILLGGGTKKRQQNDIESARALWKEYKLERRTQDASRQEL